MPGAFSKVILNGTTLMDVTGVTVTEQNLLAGNTAVASSGETITGRYVPLDISDTTAAASDVAAGKYFYTAAGVRTAGTASGGGGTPVLKRGALRPDAELAYSWTYDRLIVADEGKTIPAYTTSQATLKAAADLATAEIDQNRYDYALAYRGLAVPVYSTGEAGSGRAAYFFVSYYNEYFEIPAGTIEDGSLSYASRLSSGKSAGYSALVYYSSAQALNVYSATTLSNYSGAYLYNAVTTSMTSGSFTPKSPTMYLKGSPTYFSQAYWEALTDIRYQYVIELWRTPKGSLNFDGYALKSQAMHIIDCYNSVSGTLI